MFEGRELAGLNDQLNDYILATRQHRQSQNKLVENFHQLLADYQQLRSDYEEEKSAREKYKQLARGHERTPFVLVLVDGDSYIFRDQYIKAGADGGISAAQALTNGIKEMLQSRLPPNEADQCRVMVRIYANLAGLSKALAKAGLVGQEARSLAPFTSSFTRAVDLCDFVDAGDKKDAADFKIREMFRLFADNSQCKHIFFAGCHDVGYLSVLTPYRGQGDRVTLLKAGSFHNEFASLDLPVRELGTCFRSTPLPGIVSTLPGPSKNVLVPSKNGSAPSKNVPTPPKNGKAVVKKPCAYYAMNLCKYGDSCYNDHIRNSDNVEKPEGSDKSEKSGKKPEKPEKKPGKRPTGLKLLERYPALSHHSTTGTQAIDKASAVLPKTRPAWATIQGRTIPVNKDGHRLEIVCEKPSTEDFQEYNERKDKHKVCNSYHLAGRCEIGRDVCEFDHEELIGPPLHALKYILKKNSCTTGPACRDPTCYVGHVCQVDDCQGGTNCRFKADKHIKNMDFHCTEWVRGEGIHAAVSPDVSPSAAPAAVAVESRTDNRSGAVLLQGSTPGIPGPANVSGPVRCIMDEDIELYGP